MAWYLPVEPARALLLTGAGYLGLLEPVEGPETGVFLKKELLEVVSLGGAQAEGEQAHSLACWGLQAPLIVA